MFFGLVQSVYPENRDHALVLGIGTGMNVGAAVNVFKKVTAVDIDPLIIKLLPYFSDYNFGVHNRRDVEIILDDAFNFLMRDKNTYDTIIMDIPSPQYFVASKIWTHEYFELVKEHLTPTGVYSQWINSWMEEEGLRILFSTMQKSFSYCHIAIMRPRYYKLICRNSPLEPSFINEEEWPMVLREKFTEPFSSNINLIFDTLIFPSNNIMTKDWQAPVNTIDKPVFEFAMANNSTLRKGLKDWWIFEMAEMRIDQSAFHNRDLTINEVQHRCQLIKQWLHSIKNNASVGPCKDTFDE